MCYMDGTSAQTMKAWNPYFVRYAAAHGRSSKAQLAQDKIDWPGGKMVGFMLWIRRQWQEWAVEVGHSLAKDSGAWLTQDDYNSFAHFIGCTS